MKKSLKKAALAAVTGAMLVGTAFSAQAATSLYNGQWCQEADGGWWYKLTEDGKTFLANTWYWIKDTDGVVRCYYFDQNGWLKTNTTIDGNAVDENGRWTVNGSVQLDSSKDYATSVDFAKLNASGSSSSTGSSSSSSTGSSSSSSSTSSSTGKTSTNSSKPYKGSGRGDNPANATFTQEYQNSSISGHTVTNSWANFKMTISEATPKTDDTGSGTDFYVDSDSVSNLIVSYYRLDKYSSGNTSLDSFVNSFLADARGFKGGSKGSDITLGAYTFKQLTKSVATPAGTEYNSAYIRAVDGTDYAMVITVEKNGNSQDYLSSLKTMTKVR